MIEFSKNNGFTNKTIEVSGDSLQSLKAREKVLRGRLSVLDNYADGSEKNGPFVASGAPFIQRV
jgi:hypothetical protein